MTDPADFTIHKAVLPITDFPVVSCAGRIERWLTVQAQHDQITAWYEVDLSRGGRTDVTLRIVGTGNPRPMAQRPYLGTVQLDGLVWHVYELDRQWLWGASA